MMSTLSGGSGGAPPEALGPDGVAEVRRNAYFAFSLTFSGTSAPAARSHGKRADRRTM
jgi:hypothetical protein